MLQRHASALRGFCPVYVWVDITNTLVSNSYLSNHPLEPQVRGRSQLPHEVRRNNVM
ncbi:hypothetical protein BDR05DRAFT_129944 [Suillus weaverae]|nr:hypothetical protein BDR05DRAFT_129944 [Suillus weaverae]